MTTRAGYSTLQITLHWATAILIPATWWFSEGMGRALRDRITSGATGFEGNTLHVWLGGAAFAVILIRLIVRALSGAPDHVPGTSPLMAMAATWGHRLLYVLMLAVPAMGAAAWYLGAEVVADPHALAANALMIVALAHAALALWHQYVKKDGTLRRMMRAA
jgi:cytochrome b561